MATPVRIDTAQLIDVRLSPDGTRLRLRLRDDAGRAVSLTLPSACLNAILAATPRDIATNEVHPLDNWTMSFAGNGDDLILTLRTPEGQAVSFLAKPSQVQGMATIARFGRTGSAAARTIH